jgi:hypothetical protein
VLGRRLQLLALQHGLGLLSGSVDSSNRRLLGYYARRGGQLVQDYCSSAAAAAAAARASGVGAASGAAAAAAAAAQPQLPPSVKIQVVCGKAEAEAELRAVEGAVAARLSGRQGLLGGWARAAAGAAALGVLALATAGRLAGAVGGRRRR